MSLKNRSMKILTSHEKTKAVDCLIIDRLLGNRMACELVSIFRTSYQYKAKLKDDTARQNALTDFTTKHSARTVKQSLKVPSTPNQVWSIDFMSDRFIEGRWYWLFNVVGDFNRDSFDY